MLFRHFKPCLKSNDHPFLTFMAFSVPRLAECTSIRLVESLCTFSIFHSVFPVAPSPRISSPSSPFDNHLLILRHLSSSLDREVYGEDPVLWHYTEVKPLLRQRVIVRSWVSDFISLFISLT